MLILTVPFAFQGAVMLFDELYFHRKRGLPRWERIGHPLDTLSVLFCYLFLNLFNPSAFNMNIYIGLCVFSCLFVTKDEVVHTEKCEAKENWLHSLLFILHPIAFFAAGTLWQRGIGPNFLFALVLTSFLFMIYQILYWSFFEKTGQQ